MWVVGECCCTAVTHSCLIISFFLLLTCPQVFLGTGCTICRAQNIKPIQLTHYHQKKLLAKISKFSILYIDCNGFGLQAKRLATYSSNNWVLQTKTINSFSKISLFKISKHPNVTPCTTTQYKTTKGSWVGFHHRRIVSLRSVSLMLFDHSILFQELSKLYARNWLSD